MNRATVLMFEWILVSQDKNSIIHASEVLRRHNSERGEDNVFQRTRSVTQNWLRSRKKVTSLREKKWFHKMWEWKDIFFPPLSILGNMPF